MNTTSKYPEASKNEYFFWSSNLCSGNTKGDWKFAKGTTLHLVQIVRRGLIDVVVEPIGIDELTGRSPITDGLLVWIIMGEVMLRDSWIKSFSLIAKIFFF